LIMPALQRGLRRVSRRGQPVRDERMPHRIDSPGGDSGFAGLGPL
jgi:hypothetical protein